MIVTVRYSRPSIHDEMEMVAQMIDCQRLYKLESKKYWGFMAYNHDDKLIAEHKFEIKSSTKAFVMDNGRTIDVLPRR